MSVAVITGSSSGLGREYVNAVVNQFPEVDEIWMIARRLRVVGRKNAKPLDLTFPRMKVTKHSVKFSAM